MTALVKLPVFDSSFANCEACELLPQLERNQTAFAYRPQKFNGIMIVGEGPGAQEVAKGRPFVGISGQLLDTLLSDVGIEMDECWITNATCCKPPPTKDKALHQQYPNAIPSCLGRLEQEIAAVRPRIILALGAAAWVAVSGYDVKKIKTVPFDCEHCDPGTRKIGPVIQCAAAIANPADNGSTSIPCGWHHAFDVGGIRGQDALGRVHPDELTEIKQSDCPNCGASLKRLRPKMMKCPQCGGRKRRNEEHYEFDWDYNITAAAGGIFEPAPAGSKRLDHELSSWLGEQGVAYVVPTYHPAYILRGQQFLAKTVQKHLQKIKRLLNGAKPSEVNFVTTRDASAVREFVFGWEARGEEPPHFSIDIETEAIGEDDVAKDARKIRNVTKIKCIGISTLSETLVVDTRAANPADANDELLAALYDFLTDARIAKSAHHGFGYDWPVIELLWNILCEEMIPGIADDTMHAHINLYPDEPHKLEHLAFEVADVHAWKPAKRVKNTLVHESFEDLARYNARDTWHTRLAIDHFGVDRGRAIAGGRMDRAGLSRVYEVDSRLRQIALQMTMTGVPLNYKAFRAVGDESRALIADADKSTREALIAMGYPTDATAELNFNSPPQLISLMFGSSSFLQLTAIDYTDKHQPSTSKVALQKLLATVEDTEKLRVLNGLITLRKQQYIAKNFVFAEDMQPWADGRIHFIWQPWGTRTGRWSSSPNGQNIPIWLRKAFEAPRGRCIVGADGDQLELRGIAWLSGDKELIRRALGADEKRKLEPDYDPHSYVSSLAFSQYTSLSLDDPRHKKPESGAKITKCHCETCRRKALRDIVKRVIYGLNYGAGAATVLEAIYNGGYEGPPITIAMVEHVKKTVFEVFTRIPIWRDNQVKLARENGAIFSPLHKRRRIFPLAGFPGIEIPVTEIYNFPIQTCGGDIMNEAIIALDDALADVDPTARIIAQIHDAIYVEADEHKGEEVKKLLVACMSSERTLNGVTMRFSASGKVGKTLVS